LSILNSRIWSCGKLVLDSKNNTFDEIIGINNAVSCYEEEVKFGACFVTSLFASFDKI